MELSSTTLKQAQPELNTTAMLEAASEKEAAEAAAKAALAAGNKCPHFFLIYSKWNHTT